MCAPLTAGGHTRATNGSRRTRLGVLEVRHPWQTLRGALATRVYTPDDGTTIHALAPVGVQASSAQAITRVGRDLHAEGLAAHGRETSAPARM